MYNDPFLLAAQVREHMARLDAEVRAHAALAAARTTEGPGSHPNRWWRWPRTAPVRAGRSVTT